MIHPMNTHCLCTSHKHFEENGQTGESHGGGKLQRPHLLLMGKVAMNDFLILF